MKDLFFIYFQIETFQTYVYENKLYFQTDPYGEATLVNDPGTIDLQEPKILQGESPRFMEGIIYIFVLLQSLNYMHVVVFFFHKDR